MTNIIEAVKKTRKNASDVLATVLKDVEGKSEMAIRDEILTALKKDSEIYPTGWYDPPTGGAAVLFGSAPYERLQFATLRNPESWPSKSVFGDESVGTIYVSPVERKAKMIGDIGLSIYKGENETIRRHLKDSRDLVLAAAEKAKVGMRFSHLHATSMKLFNDNGGKVIGWITTNHDPMKTNLGHTVPGSYEKLPFGPTFETVRETIRSKRVYINEIEEFEIPETCAFTLEARLTDASLELPNVFFHVIVTFSEGEKAVLTNFNEIFTAVGMNYML
jgi:hypothetical protein